LLLVPMLAHLGVAAAKAREAVAVFLARGRAARLVAAALVAGAAVVWLGALVVVLRVASLIAFAAAVAWLAWLVWRVWRQRPFEPGAPRGSVTSFVRARARSLATRETSSGDRPDDTGAVDDARVRAARWEAGLADVRHAVAALHTDLLRWQERLVEEVERCQSELASQIDKVHELVGSAAPPEPARDTPTRIRAASASDLDAVLNEIEADIRLERVEEREQLLAEREARLDRRERDIAALVAQTQARIG
jgi:hypothetical protein